MKSSTAFANEDIGIIINGDGAQLTGNRAVANGFSSFPPFHFLGIRVNFLNLGPSGAKNIAQGNGDPLDCDPFYLC